MDEMVNKNEHQRLDELTQKPAWIWKACLSYALSTNACFTMEQMMAPSIVNMLISVSKDLYPNDPDKAVEMCVNHMNFFNTQPLLGAVTPGVVLGLEIEKAKGKEVPNELIQSIKAALGGSFAGIGDTVIQGMLLPILTSIAMGLTAGGSIVGPIFLVSAGTVIAFPLLYFMFKLGIKAGINGAEQLLTSDLKDRILSSIQALGIIVVGAVAASIGNVTTKLQFKVGELSIVVQEYLDQILPGMLTLLTLIGIYALLKKKKLSALKMIILIFVAAVIGYFTTIL